MKDFDESIIDEARWLLFIDQPNLKKKGNIVYDNLETFIKAEKKYQSLLADQDTIFALIAEEMAERDYENEFADRLEKNLRKANREYKKQLLAATIESEEKGREEGLKIGEERGLKMGEERGLKMGEEKGRKEMLIKTVKNFLSMGLPPEKVAEGTSISVQEVLKLAEK